MKQSWKNLTSGDEVVLSPGKAVCQNLVGEMTNTITPEMLELRTGVSQFIKISFANGIEMQDGVNTLKLSLSGGLEISDGTQTTTLSLLQLLHNNGAGKTNSVTDEQMVISDGTNLTVAEATGVNVGHSDGRSSALTAAQLYLDDGAGKTNSITDEQMVISASGKLATYAVGSIAYTQSGGSLDLSIVDGLVIENDGATLNASPFGVDLESSTGQTAQMSSTAGIDLNDGAGGTVSIDTQSGESISFQATEGCDVDGTGEPITTSAKVLRGAATPV